jgi:hypothetical protein
MCEQGGEINSQSIILHPPLVLLRFRPAMRADVLNARFGE